MGDRHPQSTRFFRVKYPVISGIEVPRVDYDKLSSDRIGESSATIRGRVQAARHIVPMSFRERQLERFAGINIVCPVLEPGLPQRRYARSPRMGVAEVRKFCPVP